MLDDIFLEKLIEKAKENNNIASDSKLSVLLGHTRTSISQIRTGRKHPSDELMVKLCKLAGEKPVKGLMYLNALRTKGETKKIYQEALKKVSIYLFLMVFSLIALSPNNAYASPSDCDEYKHEQYSQYTLSHQRYGEIYIIQQ